MKKLCGFTLIEVAIVLLIVAFTLGSLLIPLGSKLEEKSINDAKVQIIDIKQAVINFTISNRRMPCPDTDNDGIEDLIAGSCTNVSGQIPYVSLATPHRQDPWGQRFIYRVTGIFADNTDGTGCTGPVTLNASIQLCSSGNGDITVQDYDIVTATSSPAANGVTAVILSTGRNTGVGSLTQAENTDNDDIFYKMNYGDPGSSMPFNDIVVWISANEIVGELVKAQIIP